MGAPIMDSVIMTGQMITVEHTAKDGWHEFTCLEVPGFHLIATDDDLEEAYAQVPEAIAQIIEADQGTPMIVELENSYSEYLAKIPESMRPASVRYYSIKRAA
jgi:hypothetical protein